MDETEAVIAVVKDPAATINFLAYCACAVLGQVGYAAKLWLTDEIPCVFDRFRHNPKATVYAVIANFSVVGGFGFLLPWAQMPLQDINVAGLYLLHSVPVAAISMGLFQGWSADSGVNKNARGVWTKEQRDAAKKPDGAA